jgi:NAD(P)-dependent dehydrogenase (short-subunit alcohol dehydrogenase family)
MSNNRAHDGRLAGSVALVTGAGRGVGRMVARALSDAGAAVGLLARTELELTEALHDIEAGGGTAITVRADVTDEGAVATAISRVRAELGPIDLLVNNAGIIGPVGAAWNVGGDEWWRTMEVNLHGLFTCTQRVLPEMVARRRGRIINMTSQAGVYRWPLVSAYSVSKAAVAKLTENLARETSRYGVTVFSVHPGLLPIGMAELATTSGAAPDSPEGRIWTWVQRALRDGHGASPRAALQLILRVAAGDADALSGRHLSVHDDLDAVLEDIDQVRERDLYVLHPQRLSDVDARAAN